MFYVFAFIISLVITIVIGLFLPMFGWFLFLCLVVWTFLTVKDAVINMIDEFLYSDKD